MPVKPLNLDDRNYADLVEEGRLLIPRYVRSWTDHNVSDPGIMLFELFAWLTEALLYRINRVPDASRMRLLELLGATFQPAAPAILELRVEWQGEDSQPLPVGSRVRADWGTTQAIVFETLHSVDFTAQQPMRTITARQTERLAGRQMAQVSDGQRLQLFRLEDGFLVPPPRWPQVTVGDEQWEFKSFLSQSGPADEHFTFKPWLEAIVFGDGNTGAIPPDRAAIKVSYHPDLARPRIAKDQFQSRGRPWQVFRLSRPLQLPDPATPGDLEPNLQVQEPNGPKNGTAWKLATSFLDMEPGAQQYVLEPWHNGIRFGDGTHGKIPAAGATIQIAYHQTFGAEGNIPTRSQFSFWSHADAENRADTKAWTKLEHLKVDRWQIISPGRNPTSLDEARSAVLALLEPGWRAVTRDDFVSIVQQNNPDVARVVCLPGHDPADPGPATDQLGHVGIIAIPQQTAKLTNSAQKLHRIVALMADGLHMVASSVDGSTRVWDVKAAKELDPPLADKPPGQLILSPDGLRAVVVPTNDAAALWDVPQGRWVGSLQAPASADTGAKSKKSWTTQAPQSLGHAVFSPDSRHLATVAADDRAFLWETTYGVLLKKLGVVLPSVAPLFSPDGQMLVAAQPDNQVLLHRLAGDRPLVTVELDAAPSHLAFSPDGSRLAIATADARVRLGRVGFADGALRDQITLQLDQPARELIFVRDGLRVATLGSDGEAILWSTRTGARLVALSQEGAVEQVTLSGDGRWLATVHRDSWLRCWNSRTGREIAALPQPTPMHAAAFSPSGNRLIVVSTSDTSGQQAILLRAWDLRGERARDIGTCELPESRSAIMHASGRWLAYNDDRLVHVWDIEQCRDITVFYADLDDPCVQATGWYLVTSDDSAAFLAGDQPAAVRSARSPYLWIVSAIEENATENQNRTVQVLNAEQIYQVDTTLTPRKLVTSQLHVQGPSYGNVDISLRVARHSQATSADHVKVDINDALAQFFDPLHGGPDRSGWPLGRPVYASEIYQVVEAVATVDHVEDLALNNVSSGRQGQVAIAPQGLVTWHVEIEVE